MRAVRILLIEDDAKLAQRTAEYLGDHGVEVDIVGDGETGLEHATRGAHDIVLIDVMLPGLDGLEVCRRLRQRSQIPVIMLTARGDEVDRVLGLELGADDYVPKPFSPRELLARIRAVLRRQRQDAGPRQRIVIGTLLVDRDRRIVTIADKSVELTAYQFDVLWALAESADRVLTRQQLYGRVRELRGEPAAPFDPAVDRSIDVHLSNVRQALSNIDPIVGMLIKTVRGVGYVLSESER